MSVRIYTSAHFPRILTIISIRPDKKFSMIFSSNLDHREVNPLMHVKLSRQDCLAALFFGTEFFTFTPTLLLRRQLRLPVLVSQKYVLCS